MHTALKTPLQRAANLLTRVAAGGVIAVLLAQASPVRADAVVDLAAQQVSRPS